MKFIDHIKNGDYDELLPYFPDLDFGKYYSILREITDIVRDAETKDNALQSFIRELDCAEVTPDSTFDDARFDGNPRTAYGKAWIKKIAEMYGLDENSDSINMLHNAICIYQDRQYTAINPKRNKRNYNRYIASEIGMITELYSPTDCLVFITTSSEYTYNEKDIEQIKQFLKKDLKNLIIHSIIDDSCGKGLELDIYICVCDVEFSYDTSPARIKDTLKKLFDYDIKPFCLYPSDFDMIINYNDLYRIAELTTRPGIDSLVEQLKLRCEYCTIPTAQTAALCLEYKKEFPGTYLEIKKVLETLESLMPHTSLVWGARENHTLPDNGYKITILTDIPDDYYHLHLLSGCEEV